MMNEIEEIIKKGNSGAPTITSSSCVNIQADSFSIVTYVNEGKPWASITFMIKDVSVINSDSGEALAQEVNYEVAKIKIPLETAIVLSAYIAKGHEDLLKAQEQEATNNGNPGE